MVSYNLIFFSSFFKNIVHQMKMSLGGHRRVQNLHSVEVFLTFVRSIFMISLTLAFSPITQDTDLARFLERLVLELYRFVCTRAGQDTHTLTQSSYSVRFVLCFLFVLILTFKVIKINLFFYYSNTCECESLIDCEPLRGWVDQPNIERYIIVSDSIHFLPNWSLLFIVICLIKIRLMVIEL